MLAKHTPVLTSLPWLSLGQAPVLSSVLSSGQALTQHPENLLASKTIAYNVQHPLNEREHIKFCQMLVYLSLKEQI